VPASRHAVADERLLPVEVVDVAGEMDFREARAIGTVELNHAFTDLARDERGHATVELRDPATDEAVALWVDRHHPWLMVFSADEGNTPPRRGLAVEPMTAPPDAFRSGRDLLTLAPAGETGDEVSVSWGIRALE
jgi:aldose 1-epimerase